MAQKGSLEIEGSLFWHKIEGRFLLVFPNEQMEGLEFSSWGWV